MSNRTPAVALGLLTLVHFLFTTSPSDASTPSEAPPAESRDDAKDGNGFDADTDHLRVGVIGGVGLPRPLALEALVKIERYVAIGAEYSVLPKMSFLGVETTFWAAAADLRVFPFRSGFFLGLRAGYQRLSASATVAVASLGTLTESATAESVFMNPRLGFLWTWANGFTVGLDAGVQLPVSASISSTLPEGIAELDASMKRVANTLGHEPVPTIDLLRVGFLF